MLSKESFSAHPSLHPVQFPNTLFFSKPSFHPGFKKELFITTFLQGQIQKEYFYHNIPSRAVPKRILLSQPSKSNTVLLLQPSFHPEQFQKEFFLSHNLPSIQGSSKRNTFITTFLPSREVPKGILLSQHSFHPGKFQKEYFYHNIPSIQGSSKRNTFMTTFLPSREVPGQFHEIRKWFLISKYWFL